LQGALVRKILDSDYNYSYHSFKKGKRGGSTLVQIAKSPKKKAWKKVKKEKIR